MKRRILWNKQLLNERIIRSHPRVTTGQADISVSLSSVIVYLISTFLLICVTVAKILLMFKLCIYISFYHHGRLQFSSWAKSTCEKETGISKSHNSATAKSKGTVLSSIVRLCKNNHQISSKQIWVIVSSADERMTTSKSAVRTNGWRYPNSNFSDDTGRVSYY